MNRENSEKLPNYSKSQRHDLSIISSSPSAVEEEKNKEILSLLRPQKAGTFDPYFRHSFLHFKRIEDRGEDRRVLLTKCFLTPSCIFLVNSSGKMKSTTSASSIMYTVWKLQNFTVALFFAKIP